MDGWVDRGESQVKDCLEQSKNYLSNTKKIADFIAGGYLLALSVYEVYKKKDRI